ncbi:MAG: hypothetical protein APF81_00145 [Desulfosporosinus sp. BRH_c37]|nr:MAG: hypothetical protein APF81_00145 [Desulfosporosinus sp. BRH_c37]
MAGINVLSDIQKGGSKLEKISNPKEKDGLDSSNNTVTVFAALLSGAMNLNADSKGQNSKVGEDLGEGQSVDQPVQSTQNIPNIQNLFALSFPSQLILQSGLPAGKEANSGNVASQGKSADDPSLVGLNEVSLSTGGISAPTGMSMSKSQGDNPGIAELDKYRQAIAEFLVELSGEITNSSLKGASLSSKSTNDHSLDMAKIVQGWMMLTDEVANKFVQASSGQAIESVEISKALEEGGATTATSSASKAFDFLEALSGDSLAPVSKENPIGSEKTEVKDFRQNLAKIIQGWMTVTDKATPNSVLDEAIISGDSATPASKGSPMSSEKNGEKDLRQSFAKILHQALESVEIPKALQEGGATTANSAFNEAIISGDSAAPAPKGNLMSSEKTGVMDLHQDLAKIIQSFMTLMDDVAKEGSNSTNQKGIQPLLNFLSRLGFGNANPVLNGKASTLQAALNPIPSQEVKDVKMSQGVNEALEAEDGIIYPATKGSSKLHVQQKLDILGTKENITSKISPRASREEAQKGVSSQSTDVSGVKDTRNQNLSAGIGASSNLVVANVADGKTIAIPVWEQISTALREQVKNRSQDLKQLDIQLHPEDLGKIQINLRWDKGQVHLQVYASEAATGQILQSQLSDLRHTLTNQGVNCGMLEMGQGSDRQQNPQGNESQRAFNQTAHPDEDEELISVPNSLSPGQPGVNQINVIA